LGTKCAYLIEQQQKAMEDITVDNRSRIEKI